MSVGPVGWPERGWDGKLAVEIFLRRQVRPAVVRKLWDHRTCSRFQWWVVIVLRRSLECYSLGGDGVILPCLVAVECNERSVRRWKRKKENRTVRLFMGLAVYSLGFYCWVSPFKVAFHVGGFIISSPILIWHPIFILFILRNLNF